MSPSTLLASTVLDVAQDHGQFHLVTAWSGEDDLVELIHRAIDGERIAQGAETLVILCPHQNNFEMALTVEQWSAEPPDDLPAWEEVFEASLDVGELGVLFSNTILDNKNLPVPPGSYRVRIAGRGFINAGWPGSTTPGDVWRFQFWPSTGPISPRRILSWSGWDRT